MATSSYKRHMRCSWLVCALATPTLVFASGQQTSRNVGSPQSNSCSATEPRLPWRSFEAAESAGCGEAFDISVSVYQTKNVRTTVSLDDDVYDAAIHLSHASGERLGKVLSTLARRGLKSEDAAVHRSKRGLPVFDVPANAPIIPASRIQRVIDEEDLY